MKYVTLVMSAILFALVSIKPSPSVAAELNAKCLEASEGDAVFAECDFRMSSPKTLEVLTLFADGKPLENSVFTSFAAGNQKSAWLFLIDRSNPKRAKTVKRNVELVSEQLRRASDKRLIGVATFASDLKVVMEPDSFHTNLEDKLSSITADGFATEFYSNALEGVQILERVKADRKALVILSDGKAEDTAYSRSDVAKKAIEAGVIVFGLGFAETANDTPFLQGLRRLAEDTGGTSAFVVGDQKFEPGVLRGLTNHVENGGVVRAPVKDIAKSSEIRLEVAIVGGETFFHSETVEFANGGKDPIEDELKEMPLIGKLYSVFGKGEGSWSEWAIANSTLAWAFLLLLIALLLGFVGFLVTRNSTDDEFGLVPNGGEEITDIEPSTEVFSSELQDEGTRVVSGHSVNSIGYFEVVGSEEVRYEINGQSASIGRHSDNDIRLINDSVHRYHADVHVAPDGQAALSDRHTTNGVMVNGKRITKVTLTSGDLVELGEVRLRFISNI